MHKFSGFFCRLLTMLYPEGIRVLLFRSRKTSFGRVTWGWSQLVQVLEAIMSLGIAF